LLEQEPKTGGLLPLAAMLKDIETKELMDLAHYLTLQMQKAGVTIKTGTGFTPSLITELKPDVIILAAGGVAAKSAIPGIDGKNVVSGATLKRQLKRYSRFFGPKTLADLTKIWMPIGKQVVVIGGTIHGCELAEFLIKRGRKVTILHSGTEIGEGMTGDDQFQFMRWIAGKKEAAILTGVTIEKVSKTEVTFKTNGKSQTISADTVALALPLNANTLMIKNLEGKAPEVYTIGDCNEPHLIADAIASGATIGHSI
jgi:pyruvate/2-oxoglutarate dehydrogenase complex dihydrolipoamide dehydrogenase (E3) component